VRSDDALASSLARVAAETTDAADAISARILQRLDDVAELAGRNFEGLAQLDRHCYLRVNNLPSDRGATSAAATLDGLASRPMMDLSRRSDTGSGGGSPRPAAREGGSERS
jgi:hypothetical protein